MFASQPPWYVAGPLLGGCVVLMYLLANTRLGVVGGFSEVVERASERRLALGPPGWFVVGIVGGGLAFALVTGGTVIDGYGWLTREFSGGATLVALLGSGLLIGYGAKTAGGCTSGNGLCGNAIASPAAGVATATFFATAVGVSLLTAAIFGSGV